MDMDSITTILPPKRKQGNSKSALKPMRRLAYENLPFIPFFIAETVCEEEYTGIEVSIKHRSQSQVDKIESLRKAMYRESIADFATLANQWCLDAFNVRADWFMKCAKSKTDAGRDQLYMWIRHWLSAYLTNPVKFRHEKEMFAKVCAENPI